VSRDFVDGLGRTHFRAGHVLCVGVYGNLVLYSSWSELASAEGDDAADRIVRRDANGDSVSGDYLDAEAAHPAAQLREHFIARIDLDTVETAAVDGNHGALDINQIILAQIRCPFIPTRIPEGEWGNGPMGQWGNESAAVQSPLTASSTRLASAG
jgi:hypothetical protein